MPRLAPPPDDGGGSGGWRRFVVAAFAVCFVFFVALQLLPVHLSLWTSDALDWIPRAAPHEHAVRQHLQLHLQRQQQQQQQPRPQQLLLGDRHDASPTAGARLERPPDGHDGEAIFSPGEGEDEEESVGVAAIDFDIDAAEFANASDWARIPDKYRLPPFADGRFFLYQPSGGWGNQRLILRWAVIAANAMNRTLVLPPVAPHGSFYTSFNKHGPDSILHMGQVLDLDLLATRVYKGILVHDGDMQSYLHGILQHLSWRRFEKPASISFIREDVIMSRWAAEKADVVLWHKTGMWKCCATNQQPYYAFVQYGMMFAKHLQSVALRAARPFGTRFNAIHFRRGDSQIRERRSVRQYAKMHHGVVARMDKTIPLYIATDESDHEFFAPFVSALGFSTLVFARDLDSAVVNPFMAQVPDVMRGDVLGFIDQIICVHAERYAGSSKSTFSYVISAMRNNKRKSGRYFTRFLPNLKKQGRTLLPRHPKALRAKSKSSWLREPWPAEFWPNPKPPTWHKLDLNLRGRAGSGRAGGGQRRGEEARETARQVTLRSPWIEGGDAGEMSSALQDALKDKDQVKKFAKLLHAAIPLREAVQLNKRVNYFRGKKLIEVLLSDESLRKAPGLVQIQSKEEAKLVGIALLQHGFVHASEVANRKKRELRPIQNTNTFDDEGYFTWMYEGSKTMRNLLLALLVFSITGMCMFPIWPDSAKKGIWYLSVTLLIVLFVFLTVRLVLYVVFWSVGFEFWILPNFFDEDLGVADSFRPIVSFEMGNDFGETGIFRGAGLALLLAFAYWCSQQPTEFDELYAQQMDFLAELYDGKLLSDGPTDEELQKKS
ncbi:Translocation protein SEC62 [Durusdinium trenchii]|uniref:Translocation protein SEC62 n=1 Tax=Durusdinium trenchii TaxID=1381693 RepID=A0ABP0P913_9DINO